MRRPFFDERMLRIYRQEMPTLGPNILYTSPTDPLAAPLVAELSRDYDERYGLNDGRTNTAEGRLCAERYLTAAASRAT